RDLQVGVDDGVAIADGPDTVDAGLLVDAGRRDEVIVDDPGRGAATILHPDAVGVLHAAEGIDEVSADRDVAAVARDSNARALIGVIGAERARLNEGAGRILEEERVRDAGAGRGAAAERGVGPAGIVAAALRVRAQAVVLDGDVRAHGANRDRLARFIA